MSGCDQCLFTRKVETTCAFVALVRDIFRSRLQRQTSKALQPLNTLTHWHACIRTYTKRNTPAWLPSVPGRKHLLCPTGSLTNIWMDGCGSWLDQCRCVHHAVICSHVTSMRGWWLVLSWSQWPSCAVSSPSAHWQLEPSPLLLGQSIPYFVSHMSSESFI